MHYTIQLLSRYDKQNDWDHAVEDLRRADPDCANRIDRNDWYRLARALSVIEMTGQRFSDFLNEVEKATNSKQP